MTCFASSTNFPGMRLLHPNALRDEGQNQRVDADAFLFGESGELRMEAFWNTLNKLAGHSG
jgi:hypothetical protein